MITSVRNQCGLFFSYKPIKTVTLLALITVLVIGILGLCSHGIKDISFVASIGMTIGSGAVIFFCIGKLLGRWNKKHPDLEIYLGNDTKEMDLVIRLSSETELNAFGYGGVSDEERSRRYTNGQQLISKVNACLAENKKVLFFRDPGSSGDLLEGDLPFFCYIFELNREAIHKRGLEEPEKERIRKKFPANFNWGSENSPLKMERHLAIDQALLATETLRGASIPKKLLHEFLNNANRQQNLSLSFSDLSSNLAS